MFFDTLLWLLALIYALPDFDNTPSHHTDHTTLKPRALNDSPSVPFSSYTTQRPILPLEPDQTEPEVKTYVHKVRVGTPNFGFRTDLNFLSVTLNDIIFHRTDPALPWALDVRSERVKNMAKALAPAYVRIGGIRSGLMYYQYDNGTIPLNPASYDQFEKIFGKPFWDQSISGWNGNWNLTGEEWSVVMDFIQEVGWNITFCLNEFTRDEYGVWDPTNVEALLDYSEQQGYKINSFQLINEPNGHDTKFHIAVNATEAAINFKRLRNFLNDRLGDETNLIGPDITSLARNQGAMKFLKEFVAKHGSDYVDAITMHHYYLDGKTATLNQYLDMREFSALDHAITRMSHFLYKRGMLLYKRGLLNKKPIIISESADAWSGGAKNLSNAFVATLMYLDQLGYCAEYGILRLHKQSFHSGYYGLLDERSLDPNPTFWVTLLYKRLVVGPVLYAWSVKPSVKIEKLRIYAHCARTDIYRFNPGAIVLYYVNVNDTELELKITEFDKVTYDYVLYQLTSINGTDEEALRTNKMLLNGRLLEWTGDEEPAMIPKFHNGADNVVVQPLSLGFVVINNANYNTCKT